MKKKSKYIELWNDVSPPYGYFQIREVYNDDTWWLLASIDGNYRTIAYFFAFFISIIFRLEFHNKTDTVGKILKREFEDA